MNRGPAEEKRLRESVDPAASAAPLSIDEASVVRDVEVYGAALKRGEHPDRRRLLEKHPGFAGELAECLDGLELIQQISPDAVECGGATADVPLSTQRGVLGDFRILREIGCGGMGVVYEVEQISLGRRVALKVLPFASMLDPRQLQRFQNEARAAASLHHPNIVGVHAVGSERGVHFYAMEYIEGRSLAQVIHELRQLSDSASQPGSLRGNALSQPTQRLVSNDLTSNGGAQTGESVSCNPGVEKPAPRFEPPAADAMRRDSGTLSSADSTHGAEFFRAVAKLGIQAAEALAHAHESGVVHRDIKPSNVLVDARGHLWITDFGLAQTQTATNLTLTGDLLGTLRYMSPEQTQGRVGAVDGRTDIYSLGVTLYELLTLRPPFDSDERPAILRQILEGEPKPLRHFAPSLPRDLETVVLTAMAAEPIRRYATAHELADDLRRFLERRPIRARRPTLLEHTGKWAQRNQLLVLVATLFLILTSVGSTVGLFLILAARNEAIVQRDLANDRQRLADESRRVAEQRARELREQVYAADIRLAHQAWKRADLQWAIDSLDRCRPRAGETDLRGFEWHYLWALCHPPQRTLSGHAGDVHCVAFAPDGKTLASTGQDGTVRVWDLATLTERYVLPGSRGEVTSVTFSPDGVWLASACEQGTVVVSEATTGKEVVTLRIFESDVYCVAFSPDSRLLATGGNDPAVKLWSTATWKERPTLAGHTAEVHTLAFSPDGKTLATGGGDSTIRLWNVATGRTRAVLTQHEHEVLSVAFSADGRWLASASADRSVAIWNPVTGKVRSVLDGHLARVNSVAFSPDNRLLASASKDGSTRLWDVTTGKEVKTIRGHVGRAWWVAFSPVGATLATSGGDGVVRLWSAGGSQEFERCPMGDYSLCAMSFSSDGRLWACTWAATHSWDILSASGRDWARRFAATGSEFIQTAAFTRDCRWVATCNRTSGELLFFESAGDRAVTRVGVHDDASHLAISADGRTLASFGSTGPSIRLWDTANCRELSVFQLRCGVCAMGFAPHSQTLYAGCSDHTIRRWDVQTGQCLSNLEGHENEVYALAFSPDGRLLASGSTGRRIRLWDLRADKQVRILIGHSDYIDALAFSPDGRTLASASRDATVKLWSVSSGRELLSFDLAGVDSEELLAFSPDGKTLALGFETADCNAELLIWPAFAGSSPTDNQANAH